MPGRAKTKTSKNAQLASVPGPKTRQRKLTRRNKKSIKKQTTQVPGAFRLLGRACRHLWRHKKLFAGILLVYAILYFVFVKGLATNFQLTESRELIQEAVGDELGTLGTAAALLGLLLGTAGSVDSDAAAIYQTVLLFIVSLAVIWALRQTYDRQDDQTLKASFYKSTYPAIPYLLVWLVIALQFIPALIGVSIYGIVANNGIAVGAGEQVLWLLVMLVGVAVSVYFTSSSIIASYIVTLPNMTPMQALRSAKKLARFRRFLIIRKVVFLPVILLLSAAVILFPLVIIAPVIAEILFLVFSLAAILIGHSYMYELYRELL